MTLSVKCLESLRTRQKQAENIGLNLTKNSIKDEIKNLITNVIYDIIKGLIFFSDIYLSWDLS